MKNKNTIIFPGSLNTNGITTSLINFLKEISKDGRDITFWIPKQYYSENAYNEFKAKIPDVKFDLLVSEKKKMNLKEKIILNIFFKDRPLLSKINFLKKSMDNFFKDEAKRIFKNKQFDYAIDFTGYAWYPGGLIRHVDSKCKSIFVHNDMIAEYKHRKNFSKSVVFENYKYVDNVIIVGEYLKDDLIAKSKKFSNIKDKIKILPNIVLEQDEISVRKDEDIEFKKIDKNIKLTADEVEGIISDNGITKVSSMGRFSYEKNHLLLIKSFLVFLKENKDSYLVLIGSNSGKRSGQSFIYKLKLKHSFNKINKMKRIIIFNNINPYPVLSKCDVFVLSSRYEGNPLATIEAASLGLPVISTNIPPMQEQSKKYNSAIVVEKNTPEKLSESINEQLSKSNRFPIEDYNNFIKKEIKILFY